MKIYIGRDHNKTLGDRIVISKRKLKLTKSNYIAQPQGDFGTWNIMYADEFVKFKKFGKIKDLRKPKCGEIYMTEIDYNIFEIYEKYIENEY